MQPEDAPKTVSMELPISPESYNAIIGQVVPVEIRVTELEFGLKDQTALGILASTASLEVPELKYERGNGDDLYYVSFEQLARFTFLASEGTVAAEGRVVIEVKLRVSFQPPSEFWEVFKRRNLKLYTQPLIRETLASLAMRAGLTATPLSSIAVEAKLAKSTPLPLKAAETPKIKRKRKS